MPTSKPNPVYQKTFVKYVSTIQNKHEKPLKPQQIRFLRYPFITSVFWAKSKKKTVTKQNLELYYNTIFKQLSINF
jgi:hypothetical protein